VSKKLKVLCALLSLVLLLTQAPVLSLAETVSAGDEAAKEEILDADVEDDAENDEEEEIVFPDELIVGHPTITKGDFFTEMFGNDTADIDVRALIHGYNLVNWDQNQGVYVVDPTVVEDYLVVDDEVGNRTYYLALAKDLYYSDGTPITAWDYAFSLLLMMSPEIEQIGGKIYRAQHILGFDDYITKKTKALSGVQVVDDYQLAITLDHEFLPYFFETGLLLCVPYPISVLAPGCKVYSDEENVGIYIGNEDQSVTEPLYTAELLQKTILDPETGYNSRPSVVSGPYKMVSYDGVTAHFVINEYFKGAWFHNTLPGGDGPVVYIPMEDEEGNQRFDLQGNAMYLVKPTIEKIAFTEADNDTLIQMLRDGELHLVNKVVYGPTILDGMQSGGDGIRFQNYPRIGLAFLTFTFDWPTVHEKEVRQAIAWCMDREQLMQDYTQGFGLLVNGYYGWEQWEYLLVTHQLDYPVNFVSDYLHQGEATGTRTGDGETTTTRIETTYDENGEMLEQKLLQYKNRFVSTEEEYESAIAAWEALSLDKLTVYTVDTDKANALLNSAQWTLNENGDPYRPGEDKVRYKMIDGELVGLDLKMMYPEGNHIVDTLQENFIDNLNACGIQLTLVPTPMQDLLLSYYRETERTTDMIYLATNFHVVVDPSITYSTDTTLNHEIWNNTYSDDQDLYWRAVNMRKTDPMDVFDYVTKWVSFQERYNEVLPAIPIYSNIYFDFFTDKLQNYFITSQVTWSQAILQSYFGLPSEGGEEESLDDEDSGDLAVFDD